MPLFGKRRNSEQLPIVPLGAWIQYGGTRDPDDTDWLLCDGRALARTGRYAPLFAVIGTAYGSGDGSTTFNLPAPAGYAPIGAGTSAEGSTRTHGRVGGRETHLLTTNEIPGHTHSMGILMTGQLGIYTALNNVLEGSADRLGFVKGGVDWQAVSGGNTGNAGSSRVHNNMQPWLATNFIIRVV